MRSPTTVPLTHRTNILLQPLPVQTRTACAVMHEWRDDDSPLVPAVEVDVALYEGALEDVRRTEFVRFGLACVGWLVWSFVVLSLEMLVGST